jgi:hypothetical protein
MSATSATFPREALNSPTETEVSRSSMSNTEHRFADPNRHVVEVPDSFAIARWPRDADVPTIARCILGTLKYEPHAADTTALRHALEGVIEDTSRRVTLQKQEGTTAATNPSLIANEES